MDTTAGAFGFPAPTLQTCFLPPRIRHHRFSPAQRMKDCESSDNLFVRTSTFSIDVTGLLPRLVFIPHVFHTCMDASGDTLILGWTIGYDSTAGFVQSNARTSCSSHRFPSVFLRVARHDTCAPVGRYGSTPRAKGSNAIVRKTTRAPFACRSRVDLCSASEGKPCNAHDGGRSGSECVGVLATERRSSGFQMQGRYDGLRREPERIRQGTVQQLPS